MKLLMRCTHTPQRSMRAPRRVRQAANERDRHTAWRNTLSTSATSPSPITSWVLHGPKQGDNTQTLALAEGIKDTLGGTFNIRKLTFRNTELLTNLLLRTTLTGVRANASDRLVPPWPDLVITAGRRNEPVARWIKRAAGGAPKLVHIGRPWSNPALFDLIITTRQYFVPPAHNVLLLELPLLRNTTAALAQAEQRWQPIFASLARPWIAVLVGGDSGPYRFTATRARAMGAQLRHEVGGGGSLLVTTSGRTSVEAVAALRQTLPSGGYFFDWHRDQMEDNPYLGFLALADQFVVTAESASMLAEACATNRPVAMFDLAGPPHETFASWRWKPLTFALGQLFAPLRLRRDTGRIHALLIATGRATWLDTSSAKISTPSVLAHASSDLPAIQLAAAVERVRLLFAH